MFEKQDRSDCVTMIVIIAIMAGFLGFIVVAGCYSVQQTAYKEGYKAACQDFYNGTLKAELVNPNKNEWKMKE